MNAPGTPRLVMITPVVPEEHPEHAGGVLLARTVAALRSDVHLTVIAPDGPAVRRAVAHPRIDELIVLRPARRPHGAVLGERAARYLAPGSVAGWFRSTLADSEAVGRAVAAADVVDLQWQEQAVMIPWLRAMNPGARVTVLLHDVLSQSTERSHDAATGRSTRAQLTRWRWDWARVRALRSERRLSGDVPGAGTPDALGVLSEKDAALLPRGQVPVVVVRPPLGTVNSAVVRSSAASPPELLMVAYLARWENEDGLRWFLSEILPVVRASHADLVVRVAGTGIRPHVAQLAREHGVELLGFVAGLEPLYATADAVFVPLRQGAGLKFKVVEALAAGVPVVTTPVGAEGVGPKDWFAAVTEDPEDFATALLDVLAHPDVAQARAAAARQEIAQRYGETGFRAGLAALLGNAVVGPAVASGGTDQAPGEWTAGHDVVEPPAPEVSVVIPAHNAARTIASQLESLAHQVDAPPFEVVVADNRSTDGTADVVNAWSDAFPCGLRVVGAHARQGASHARNRGCHEARAERVLFCDADDRVQQNWVAEMAKALDNADAVGSDAVPVVGSEVHHEDRTPGLRTVLGSVNYVISASLGVRRPAWASVGGLDEAFPAGHEEVDFCRRLTVHGFTLRAVHSTAVLYTQRSDAAGRRHQAFHYAEGYMLLWTRLAQNGVAPPVSFTGSVRHAVALTVRAPFVAGRPGGLERAHALGWAWGIVAGHLRYRVLGRPPEPLLWRDTR